MFAQLVDDATGIVLGNQITPIAGDARRQAAPDVGAARSRRLTAHAGAHLTLQMVATTTAYAEPRLGGSITFDSIAVSLPVAAGLPAR